MAAFEKEAWLASKQEKLTAAKAALEAGLAKLQTSEDWTEMLKSMAQLGKLSVLRYSFTNQLLIQGSRPGTARAATFQTWKENGRFVKKGEKGIAILAPRFKRRTEQVEAEEKDDGAGKLIGFRLLTVFGEEQTEGAPLPSTTPPDITSPEAFHNSIEVLRQVAMDIPGAPISGVEIRDRQPSDYPGAYGWFNPSTRAIVVLTEGRSRTSQFRTLCHEVAHALLHPLGDAHGRPEREVEAESTAFVVCHALGVDTGSNSFPYVSSWAGSENPLKMVAASGQRIADAAATILDGLCGQAEELGEEDAA